MTKTLLSLALLASLATACGPRWTVLHQAAPDPFLNHPQFTVEPLHFERTLVGGKTEAAYAAEKEAPQQASWQEDKQGMTERFSAALASSGEGLQVTGPGGGGAIVRPVVTFIEPGFYVGVASHASRVDMTIDILDAQGNMMDEITIQSSIGATMTNPAVGNRLRQAAEDLGRVTAKYLKSRVSPQ